jgi:GT2 family glycosyltransferase
MKFKYKKWQPQKISIILDPLIYCLRFGIISIKTVSLFAHKIIWKHVRVGSELYKIIRKIIRKIRQGRSENSEINLLWKENLLIFISKTTYIEWIMQRWNSKISNNDYLLYLSIKFLDLVALERTISSLSLQSFPHWKLLIRFSPEVTTAEQSIILDEVFTHISKKQCQVVSAPPITGNHTAILYLVLGDFVCPDCLYRIDNAQPADLISFDITIPDNEVRKIVRRPSGFSPELMISNNYLSHAAIRLSIFNEVIEAQRISISECIDSDFSVLYQLVQDDKVKHVHIGQILYEEVEQRHVEDREEGIRKQLVSDGLLASNIERVEKNGLHVTWQTDREKVSIIIPTMDNVNLLRVCINSILQNTQYPNYEIIIVDNHSQEVDTLAYYASISKIPNVKMLAYNEPFNFSKAINLGVSIANGKYVLVFNNDMMVIQDDWLSELVQWAMLPGVGVVGAQLLYPNNRIQHAGVVFDANRLIAHVFCQQQRHTFGPHGSSDWYRNYIGVTGACQLFRREVFTELGGYDEEFQLSFSDIDICIRLIKKGYRVVYNPFSILYHYESATRADNNPTQDISRALTKFRDLLISGDPFFSDQVLDAFNPRPRLFEPQREQIMSVRVNSQLERFAATKVKTLD